MNGSSWIIFWKNGTSRKYPLEGGYYEEGTTEDLLDDLKEAKGKKLYSAQEDKRFSSKTDDIVIQEGSMKRTDLLRAKFLNYFSFAIADGNRNQVDLS